MKTLPSSSVRTNRGSVLITVVIFTAVLTTMLAGVALYQGSVGRLQVRAEALIQARYTAESAVNEAFDDVVEAYSSFTATTGNAVDIPRTHFARNPLPPLNMTPLNWEPTAERMELGDMGGGRIANYSVDAMQIVPGILSTANAVRYAVSGAGAPANKQLAGRLVISQTIPILASARVRMEDGSMLTAYSYRDMAVQMVPMFGDAVWFLPHLEIANGPPLRLAGTLYSGGDLYISGGGDTTTITSVAYVVGDMFRGRHPVRRVAGHSSNMNLKVELFDSQTNKVVALPLNLNPSSNFDSSNPEAGAIPQTDWKKEFAKTFGDGVLANMPPMNLPGSEPNTTGENYRDNGENGSRFLIEPGEALPAQNDSSYSQRLQQEAQKLYHRAGLRITYDIDRDASGNVSGYVVQAYKPGARNSKGLVTSWTPVDLPEGVARIALDHTSPTASSANFSLYDDRRAASAGSGYSNSGYITTLDFDVAKLRNAIEAVPNTTERFPSSGNAATTFVPSADWNGVIYFESLNPAAGTGVRLHNGQRLPNLSASNPVGLTVATNDVLYVQGHFNADGSSSTGSEEHPDFYDSEGEPIDGMTRTEWPAALIADAVNILTPNFQRTGYTSNAPDATTSFVEVSAAILSGIVPSTRTAYSGGLENFPRFLENWEKSPNGKATLRYRGSMVCLFDSEVATERWGRGSAYNPPIRKWGFNKMFGNGELPPATPMAIVDNGLPPTNFRFFGQQEYEQEYGRIVDEIVAATAESRATVEGRFAPYNAAGQRLEPGILKTGTAVASIQPLEDEDEDEGEGELPGIEEQPIGN